MIGRIAEFKSARHPHLRLSENLCAFLVVLRRRNFVGLITAEQIVQLLLFGHRDICTGPLHRLEYLRWFPGFLLFLFRARFRRSLSLGGALSL